MRLDPQPRQLFGPLLQQMALPADRLLLPPEERQQPGHLKARQSDILRRLHQTPPQDPAGFLYGRDLHRHLLPQPFGNENGMRCPVLARQFTNLFPTAKSTVTVRSTTDGWMFRIRANAMSDPDPSSTSCRTSVPDPLARVSCVTNASTETPSSA